jgi:hypothetical protein
LSEDGLLFIRNDFTASDYAEYELVFGSIFLPDTVQELISKDKVLLLMVYGKGTENLLLSELDVDAKYMLDLPHGQYYFIAFILDAGYEALLNSRIYAIGFPSKDNLNSPEREDFYLNHPADILEFIDPAPVNIQRGGPFYLNLIMVDAEKIPDFTVLFSEILQEDETSPPF